MTRQLALFFAWARLSRATGWVLGRMEGIGCDGQLWWVAVWVAVECFDGRLALWQ